MRKSILSLLAFGFLALSAAGETTRFWEQHDFAEFDKGTARGVALRSDGELLLAPRYQEATDPNLEFVWAIAEGPQGKLYLGGGSPAQVIELDPNGESRVVFESKELEVHALLADPQAGTLYIATSPDGSVYRLPRDGEPEVLFEPEAKYLWDLARRPDGTLFLATGDKGEIFRIGPDGKGELFFASEEAHVRVLAFGPDGNLYAGTEPNGLVLRLSPSGEAFVLYETPRKEVTALRFDRSGNLYVASIGRKEPTPGVPTVPGAPQAATQVTVTARVTPRVGVGTTGEPRAVPGRLVPFLTAGGSDVFRINPDGYPEALWSSESDLVYSLAFDAEGRLLAGTGNQGKLLAIDSPHLYTHLAESSSQQITVLHPVAGGRVYLGTANPGKLFALGPELEADGVFESDIYDAELFSHWGRIAWRSRWANPPHSLRLYTRSGNTSNPQKNWSPWSEAYTDARGSQIASPPARFLQWKAALTAADSRTPSLSGVSVAYLRRNVAPVVEKVIVQAPGISVRSLPSPGQQTESVQLELPSPPARQARRRGQGLPVPPQQAPQRIEPPPQGIAEPGVRSVLWSADDENEDELVYSVYYRGEDETRWKLMGEELTERFHSWDATTLPDGAYFIKVVASDAPSNPPDLALTGENVSERFEVDNTPPRIDNLTAQPGSRTVEVRFAARDSYSPLKKAEYSLNAGDWKPVFPLSRTTDARQHDYVFQLENLPPGEHTVVVRVYDRFDNPVLAKTTFKVE